MKTPTLSPGELRDVVQGWMEGNTIEDIMYLLEKKGKPKSKRFLTRVFMGVIHGKDTGLKRSETYIEAKIRYSHRKVDNVFGDDCF